ncbi:hypothetical protein OROGR_012146 [Orobanche gracilis]
MHRCSQLAGDSSSAQAEEWPPVWKSLRDSPQMRFGMFQKYWRGWKLGLEKINNSDNINPRHSAHLKRFLRQVWGSRGYDVDVRPPPFVGTPFYPTPISDYMKYDFIYQDITEMVNFVVGEINSQAELHNRRERFEFLEVDKIVDARRHRIKLVTFRVKEVASSPPKKRKKTAESLNIVKDVAHNLNVVKIVQAMVFKAACRKLELKEWRFKPQQEGEEEDIALRLTSAYGTYNNLI